MSDKKQQQDNSKPKQASPPSNPEFNPYEFMSKGQVVRSRAVFQGGDGKAHTMRDIIPRKPLKTDGSATEKEITEAINNTTAEGRDTRAYTVQNAFRIYTLEKKVEQERAERLRVERERQTRERADAYAYFN
eukprot:748954_1